MTELIYNVEQVFCEFLKGNQLFNIPEYQRGYKWSDQQIIQLLDDILEFETGGDEELFYCLQNITIVFHENGNKFNVIDGQQRLTTITLLLSYLEKSEIVKNKIFYAVRERSNDFIQKVISNEDQLLADVIRCNDFDEFLSITSEIDKDYDFQDIYFMFTALRTMDSWFKKKEKEIIKPLSKLSFREKLLRNVKLIVNSISGIAEQELFMNLHSRRVQLDGSDLVRAILITRVAKKEMEDFDSKEVKDVVRLNERRIRIGWELDEIGRAHV